MAARKSTSSEKSPRPTSRNSTATGRADQDEGTGFSGFLMFLIVFLVGVAVVPAYYNLQYDIRTSADGIIVMRPKNTGDKGMAETEKRVPAESSNGSSSMMVSNSADNAGTESVRSLSADCARNRWLIREATRNYFKKYGSSVPAPTIFDLIGQKFLKELPNCPSGGSYDLSKDNNGDITVRCSLHGSSNK